MTDRRPVNSVNTDELEQIVRMRRSEERAAKLRKMAARGRPVGPRLSEATSAAMPSAPPAPVRRRKTLWDYVLLLIEVGAIAGLLYVLVSQFTTLQNIRALNAEVVEAIALPTLTPTALIVTRFLPSGHTPPTSPGGAQPYEASLPESIRYVVQPSLPVIIPTPGPEQPQRMVIQAIGVDAPVVQGVEWDQLKKGVGQVIGTALPGQIGNSVYTAHNDIYGEIFRDLDQLKPGDEVIVYTASEQFRYIVREWRIVEPTEVSVMNPTSSPTLTLISCYPYLVDTQRIVVFADLDT